MNIKIERTDHTPCGDIWDVWRELEANGFFQSESELLGSFAWNDDTSGIGTALISLPGISTRIEMIFASPGHAGEYIASGKARRVIHAAIKEMADICVEEGHDGN